MFLRAPLFACSLLLSAGAVPASGQIAELEAEYRQAREHYENVLAERSDAQSSYNRTLDLVRAARASEDDGRLGAAMATFYTQARSLEVFDRRLEEAGQRREAAGRALIRALDDEEEELLGRLEAAEGPAEREWLLEALARVRQRVRDVEVDVEGFQEMRILPVPDVRADPRDGPTELRAKHNLLASRVIEFDGVIEEIDERLEALERRLRRDRTLRDQEAGLARFDDLQIAPRAPSSAPSRTEGLPADPADAGLAELPLEEQIAFLRLFREQAEALRDETRAQAEEFRQRIPGAGGGR